MSALLRMRGYIANNYYAYIVHAHNNNYYNRPHNYNYADGYNIIMPILVLRALRYLADVGKARLPLVCSPR